jgi:hypothetical protein
LAQHLKIWSWLSFESRESTGDYLSDSRRQINITNQSIWSIWRGNFWFDVIAAEPIVEKLKGKEYL